MDKIRDALESNNNALIVAACFIRENTPSTEWHKNPELKQIIAAGDKTSEALALLSAPVASDARELAESIWDLVHMAGGPMTEECAMSEAAAIIERYAAERERKAREEEREACAERAAAWIEKPYALSGSNVAAHLRAAIKETGNGK